MSSITNLARTLRTAGDLAGARRLEERAVAAKVRLWGEEHPDTLISMNNLAEILGGQGDLEGARRLQERVLEVRKRVLGKEHPAPH